MDKVRHHEWAVRMTLKKISGMGVSARTMPKTHCPFDILAGSSVRVEVKTTFKGRKRTGSPLAWSYNIHRHGKIQEGEVDIFVIHIPAIHEFGLKNGFQLVIPAHLLRGMYVFTLSPKSLMTRWGQYHARWDLIKSMTANGGAT